MEAAGRRREVEECIPMTGQEAGTSSTLELGTKGSHACSHSDSKEPSVASTTIAIVAQMKLKGNLSSHCKLEEARCSRFLD